MEGCNCSQTWISKIIESKWPFSVKNPLLSTIIKFGALPCLLAIIFYLTRHEYIAKEFLYGEFFQVVWITLGPYLIWYYNKKLLPNFFDGLADILPDQAKRIMLAKKYDRMFSKDFWKLVIPLTILISTIFLLETPIFLNYDTGILGVNDIWYWIFFAWALWSTILGGMCFWGVVVTLLAVREVSKEKLNIDPLHPDDRSCGNQIPKREKYFILPIIMVHHQNIPLTHLPIT